MPIGAQLRAAGTLAASEASTCAYPGISGNWAQSASMLFLHPTRKTEKGEKYESAEQKMLAVLLKSNDAGFDDGIPNLFELRESKRAAEDRWLQLVLDQQRNGTQTCEVYCFIHGLPTRSPGT